jgi:hypothetical protein
MAACGAVVHTPAPADWAALPQALLEEVGRGSHRDPDAAHRAPPPAAAAAPPLTPTPTPRAAHAPRPPPPPQALRRALGPALHRLLAGAALACRHWRGAALTAAREADLVGRGRRRAALRAWQRCCGPGALDWAPRLARPAPCSAEGACTSRPTPTRAPPRPLRSRPAMASCRCSRAAAGWSACAWRQHQRPTRRRCCGRCCCSRRAAPAATTTAASEARRVSAACRGCGS